jgi:hemin uptake protein HemP
MRIVIIRRVQHDSRKPSAITHSPSQGQRPQAPARTTSQALLGTARELIIEHDGREYRLRLTQQGKLILTA